MKYCFMSIIGIIACFSGCTSVEQAPDFPKKWRPINQLGEVPIPIALNPQHYYRVTQLDTTVKELLSRWAEEARMPLVYGHSHDFTLFKPVLDIKSTDLTDALQQLSALYKGQGIVFYIQDNVLVASTVNNQEK